MAAELGPNEFEELAREKVSESMSAIEIALSEWEAAKTKPKVLAGRIRYLKSSYELLSNWERESLKGKRDSESTLARIEKFVAMCGRLEKIKGGASG
jgi:hypothetical protein